MGTSVEPDGLHQRSLRLRNVIFNSADWLAIFLTSSTLLGSLSSGNESSFPTSVVNVATPNVGVIDGTADKNKREIERLRSQSSLYQKYAVLWNFFLAAYEGGRDFATAANIFRHAREHPDDFNARATRLYYHNYCYPLVDFFTTFIFTETIQRDAGDDSTRDSYNDPSTMDLLNQVTAAITKERAEQAQYLLDQATLAHIYANDQYNPQRQTNVI